MSSCGNPAVDSDALMPRKQKFDRSKDCIKCKTERGNIVIRHAVYCKGCFSSLITTKFRRCLDPHINAKPDGPRRTTLKASGNLLIGFSGGLGSTVLLDIISRCYFPPSSNGDGMRGGTGHPRKDRVWKNAKVCYVDMSSAFPESMVKDRTEEVRELVRRYEEFGFVSLRLEDAFNEEWWKKNNKSDSVARMWADVGNEDLVLSDGQERPTDPGTLLRSYLSALPTTTAVSSTIATLTRLVLLHFARTNGCSHLALGTSLTSLAISLINSIAQGGGFNVPEESYEDWDPDDRLDRTAQDKPHDVSPAANHKIRLVRPLRDVGVKECSAWAWWNGLTVVGRQPSPPADGKQTIGGLTKDFIMGLERDYPATVSTIARTCAKLAPKDESDGQCSLCSRPSQRGVQDWKSRISIRSVEVADTSEPRMAHPPSPTHMSLTQHLCYACHTTLTSRSPRSIQHPVGERPLLPLPLWTRSSLGREFAASEVWKAKALGQNEMKHAVGVYLLEDMS